MATINLKRSSEYINIFRDYKIFIDGQLLGKIANGETKEFIIPAGQHTISAKIDWCSSPEVLINIEENETKTLKVGGFNNANWLMPLGNAFIVLQIILSYFLDFNYSIILLIPIFPLIIYYITIGRKKYLTLNEI